MSVTTGLNQKLTQLKLSRMREVVDSLIAQAEQQQLGYAEFLDELLNEEVLGRQENQIRRKLKAAGFPYPATLEQFDFGLRPELKRSVMVRFFDSAFVEKAGALLLIGPSGVGKTHLAIALGTHGATGLQCALPDRPAVRQCRAGRPGTGRAGAGAGAAHPL
jgi:DNA replication protein DnaC